MSPILYWMDASAPARAIVLLARYLKIDLQLKPINLWDKEHLTPEFININPQHVVPTLDDNGFIIWESPAIAAYLVGKYGKDDSLYPKDLQKRAIVDQRLHFSTGILFIRMRAMFFPLFFHGEKEIAQFKINEMLEGYQFIETFLNGHNYVAGDQLTIADFCAYSIITSVETFVPVDAKKFPNITAWLNRCKLLPGADENAAGVQVFVTRIKKILNKEI